MKPLDKLLAADIVFDLVVEGGAEFAQNRKQVFRGNGRRQRSVIRASVGIRCDLCIWLNYGLTSFLGRGCLVRHVGLLKHCIH